MIGQPYKDAPLLEVRNVHSEDCGVPTALAKDSTNAEYVGYFENQYGEQWTLQINRQAKTGILRGGDIGWDNPVSLHDSRVEDIVLNAAEYAWLAACWFAATGEQLENVAWEEMRNSLGDPSADG